MNGAQECTQQAERQGTLLQLTERKTKTLLSLAQSFVCSDEGNLIFQLH